MKSERWITYSKPVTYFTFSQKLGRAVAQVKESEAAGRRITSAGERRRHADGALGHLSISRVKGHNLLYHTKDGNFCLIRYDEIRGDGDGRDGFLQDKQVLSCEPGTRGRGTGQIRHCPRRPPADQPPPDEAVYAGADEVLGGTLMTMTEFVTDLPDIPKDLSPRWRNGWPVLYVSCR